MRHSPIHEQHISISAEMVDYGGALAPLRYGSVLTEHLAVRHTAGLFDLSHQVLLSVGGPDALSLLQSLSATDMSPLSDGICRRAILCREDGGTVDAFQVYPEGGGSYLCALNPVYADRTISCLSSYTSGSATLTDKTAQLACFALHGPKSKDMLRGLKAHTSLLYAKPDACGHYMLGGVPVLIACSRYAGEKGFEMFVPRISALEIWMRLIALEAVPGGLAALEVLRIEAGRRVYGHELTGKAGPVEAGLSDEIDFSKDSFPGRDALSKLNTKPRSKLIGLRSEISGVFQCGQEVYLDDRPCGMVTSGTASPSTNGSVAMASVKAGSYSGGVLTVSYRAKRRQVYISDIPFIEIAP